MININPTTPDPDTLDEIRHLDKSIYCIYVEGSTVSVALSSGELECETPGASDLSSSQV